MKSMSKPFKPFFLAIVVFVQILQFLYNSHAQTVEIRVKIDGSRATVEGTIKDTENRGAVTNFSLADSVANQTSLSARHRNIQLNDERGAPVPFRTLAPGELLADRGFRNFRFETELTPATPAAMAHVSWIDGDRGMLMTADLLPSLTFAMPIDLTLDLPADWKVVGGSRKMRIDEPSIPVIFIGRNLRETKTAAAAVTLDGEFRFSDRTAGEMTDEILSQYGELFGGIGTGVNVFLVRYAPGVRIGRWEAETRGATVVIATADLPISTQSEQRLHEQLRHELFHLWMPNRLSLTGDYAWFYEGFALYQSLRTGVALNRIRFDDFLDTLGRAHSADSLIGVRRSMIETSRNRWAGAGSQIYARGMLAAFLADLALLSKSKGKRSLDDVLRRIWLDHSNGRVPMDGNAAIVAALNREPELRSVVSRYITGAESVSWQTELSEAGIESRVENFETKLSVTAKPNGRQKTLLDKLGYNNWRNFLKSSK